MATATMTKTQQVEVTHSQVKEPAATVTIRTRNKLRIDPSRSLKPARKKLTSVEAQRIMAVLLDCIKKTEIMLCVPEAQSDLQRYNVLLGSELMNLLSEHNVAMQGFNELKTEAEKILDQEGKDISNTPHAVTEAWPAPVDTDGRSSDDTSDAIPTAPAVNSGAERQDEADSAVSSHVHAEAVVSSLLFVIRNIKHLCRNILRAFRANPSAAESLLKGTTRTEEHELLIGKLNELKDIIMTMLLTTPVEQEEQRLYVEDVTQRQKLNTAQLAELDAELKVATDEKDNQIKIKNDQIRQLQANQHQITKFAEENINRIKNEAAKQEAADLKNSEGKKEKLKASLADHKSQLQTLTNEHRESEQQKRSKKYKLETEVENLLQKYDTDMGNMQDEYEDIDGKFTEEKKQLHELEERFRALEEEYNRIMDERRKLREEKEAADRTLQNQIRAAIAIQAYWRSYRVRKALKSRKKKGKGKGKKK